MNRELVLVLLLLAAAVVMLVRNRPRMDVVALIMIAALPFTGVLTVPEVLAGFADPNIVLIALLFVLGEALVRTGVARRMGDFIDRRSGGSELRLLVMLMVAVAGLGSMMSSTATVAIFIPVVLRICQNTGIAPSRLMMPLSMAALISGMMTLVATTPNLVVHAELIREGTPGFGFFTNTPIGVTVLALGIAYMAFARRWLRSEGAGTASGPSRPSFRDWIRLYGLSDREYRVRVRPDSPLVGWRVENVDLAGSGVNLLAIERAGGRLLRPTAATVLRGGDILLLDVVTPTAQLEEMAARYGVKRLALCPSHLYLTDRAQDMGMVEAILPAESQLRGRTVREMRDQGELGLTTIGLRRGSGVIGEGLLDERLRVGDTLLMTGFWEDIRKLQRDSHDLIPISLPAEMDEVLPAQDRAPQALTILAIVIGLMVFRVLPNVHAVLLGCLLLGAFRCIDINSAYRSIHWGTLVLVVGMMPFALALERTGGLDLAADLLLETFGTASPRFVLAAMFVLTATLGMFISGTGAAILTAPVAFAVAEDIGASPLPFGMIVAIAAATVFMAPVSPVNSLVVGVGNYRFADFLRIGGPFSLIVLATSVALVPVILPL